MNVKLLKCFHDFCCVKVEKSLFREREREREMLYLCLSQHVCMKYTSITVAYLSFPLLQLLTGFVSGSDERVTVALEELQDLKGVWLELGKVWEQIEELREKPWLSVAPRKIRQALDALLGQLKAFPARLKQYASFEYVQSLLKSYTKVSDSIM